LFIGERLRAWREYKELSQNDLEKRLGLTRSYISRVENGLTIPKLETLARFARALEVPVFHLVYEEEDPFPPPILPVSARLMRASRNLSKRELRLLEQFNLLFGQLVDRDRQLLLGLARRMTKRMSLWSAVEEKRKPRNSAQPVRTDRSPRIPRCENADIGRRTLSTQPRSRKR
jgi:transcriptional regulator with XRE-family HTH domain